jgi:hypothetical protein
MDSLGSRAVHKMASEESDSVRSNPSNLFSTHYDTSLSVNPPTTFGLDALNPPILAPGVTPLSVITPYFIYSTRSGSPPGARSTIDDP